MRARIDVGDAFPDVTLPDHRGRPVRLADLTARTGSDAALGFAEGYPLVVVFYRGFFCPRDRAQFGALLGFQDELSVNYCKLVAISADAPLVCGAYRYGLGASFPFLSDTDSALIDRLGIRDRFESEYPGVAVPHTFVLDWAMRVHRVYYGWYFVGRPTVEELRRDLREVMSRREAWDYDRWEAPERLAAFPPAEAWLEDAPARPGAGAPRRRGRVRQFAVDDGYGLIDADDGSEVFLHFSGIPGLGYRTVPAGAHVVFATVVGPTGRDMAVDVQVLDVPEQATGSAYNQKMSGLNQ